jgi:CTP:molybdopterin cytidylyltransferase MocA
MEHPNAVRPFSAIISAGGQAGEDLASLLGVSEKCAASFEGKPLAGWAVEAAFGAGAAEVVVVCGNEVRKALSGSPCLLAEPGKNPVESAKNGLSQLSHARDIVFIPGDLPLIRAEHVLQFLQGVPANEGRWLAIALASREAVEARFGRTAAVGYLKLDGARFAAAGLSAASKEGFIAAVQTLSELSEDRKSQVKMAMRFGVGDILRFFLGRMTTERAEFAGRRIFGCTCSIVKGCAAELVMDVDTPDDWRALNPVN